MVSRLRAGSDPHAEASPAPWQRLGPVLIAGGGIGGLATALALARRGIPSHVLERRPAFSEEGAGIQIGPNGTRILADLGVAQGLAPHVAAPTAIRVHDARDGRLLTRLPLGTWIEKRHGAPYWVAHRQDLHAALLGRARGDPLIGLSLGADFFRPEPVPEGVRISTKDGRAWQGAALIGADGLWSAVRRAQFTPAAPAFTGHCAVRGTLPLDRAAIDQRRTDIFVWLHPEGHVVHYPVRGGAELALVGIFRGEPISPGWAADIDLGWVQQRTAPFPQEVRRLFADAPTLRAWGLNRMPRRYDWHGGYVALLGDAAHPVLPFLAQGAVLALEDAVVLADALATEPDVPLSLASYARQRQPRAQRVAAQSARNGQIYHLTGPLATARNLALRMLTGGRLMVSYDWLYGWRAQD